MVAPFANPVPLTVMVALPGFTGLGFTDVTTGRGFCRFTVTLALAVGSAWLMAVTVTAAGLGRSAGAV
jgi:multidrug efflux pump subunit AcrB